MYSSLYVRNFSLPARDMKAWAVCIPPTMEKRLVIDSKGVTSRLPSALHSVNEFHAGIKRIEVTVIKTSFDRFHKNNLTFPAKTNRRENVVWTEGERLKAEAGEVVQDLQDLHSKVCDLEPFIMADQLINVSSWINTISVVAEPKTHTYAYQWRFFKGESFLCRI
jgi:hypothetical protein